jgi:branched-chain amino acid transport system substrate-binding protein
MIGRPYFCRALLTVACLAFTNTGWAQEAPGVTEKTVKIGMFAPITGSLSIWGYPVLDGAAMIYKDVNEAGGINGRKIEYVMEDDGCDAAKGVAAAKKLIASDQVFMINGGVCSGATMAARTEIINNKTPMMVVVASLDALTAPVNPYMFTVAPTGAQDGRSMAMFAATIPDAKTVAFIGHTDEWTKAKHDAFAAVAAERNFKIVADEVIDRRATEATAQVLAIKRANPDIVALFTYPGETATFLRDALTYGLKAKFIGNNALVDMPALAERAGGPEALSEVYVMSALSGPVGSTELEPYEQLLKKYFPSEKPKAESFWGTAAAMVVVEALRRAGPGLTRESLLKAMEGIKDFDVGVAPCKVTLSITNHQGCDDQVAWKLVNGKIAVVGRTWRELR